MFVAGSSYEKILTRNIFTQYFLHENFPIYGSQSDRGEFVAIQKNITLEVRIYKIKINWEYLVLVFELNTLS